MAPAASMADLSIPKLVTLAATIIASSIARAQARVPGAKNWRMRSLAV